MKQKTKRQIRIILDDCENRIFDVTGNKMHIKYTHTHSLLNGTAHKSSNYIELTGDWSDLLSEDNVISKEAKVTLYYVIGHELGHLDQEPDVCCAKSLFLKAKYFLSALVRKDFRCQIRELRADYCGVIFALKALKNLNIDRQYVVDTSFNYEIKKCKKDKGDSMHLPFFERKRILTENPIFNKELVETLSTQYKCTKDEVDQLCSCAFNGTLLKFQNEIKI